MNRLRQTIAVLLAFLPALLAGSLQERINAARDGAVITVEPGEYAGPIVIDRSVTLRGVDFPLIEGNARSPVVLITADDVHIEGFRIENSGLDLGADHAGIRVEGDHAVILGNRIERVLHGIYVKGAEGARIERNRIDGLVYLPEDLGDLFRDGFRSRPDGVCTVELDASRRGNGIHLWNSHGHVIGENRILNTRDGIYFSFTHETTVRRNHVSGVRYGLHYMYSDGNAFEENRFEGNAAGSAIMYSEGIRAERNHFTNNRGRRAYGVLLQSVDSSEFEENEISGNTIGFYIENAQNNRFTANRVVRNYVGIRFSSSSSGNLFNANDFRRNLHAVETDQGEVGNRWAAGGRGNAWGSLDSPDMDGDGVGDWPHFEGDVLGGFRREHELVGLLSGSAFVNLLGFASSRSELAGIPRVRDPHPLLEISN